jgi:hypothetical protein
MAFKVGSTSYFPGVFNFPSSATIGAPLETDGNSTYFAYPGQTSNNPGTGLQYRSILTHGFLAGGYKGSSPWRSVNKTWHANDTTFLVGDQIDRAMAYGDGTTSDYNAYVHGTINAYSGSSPHTSSYNLHNGVGRQRGMQQWDYNVNAISTSTTAGYVAPAYNTGIFRPTGTSSGDGSFGTSSVPFGYIGLDPAHDGAGVSYGSQIENTGSTTLTDSTLYQSAGVGGWDTAEARDFHGCSNDQINQVGYVHGGGTSATDRLHFPTETMYTTTSAPVTAGMTTCVFGTSYAWVNFDGNHQQFNFSNQAYTTWNNTSGSSTNGQGAWYKAVSSKLGQHYVVVGDNIFKTSDSTGNTISTFAKSYTGTSEENGEMGQNWGYFLGNYNGQQNNQTMKIYYTTDSCVSIGAAGMPKGHFGQSSAACSFAAATITSGYPV